MSEISLKKGACALIIISNNRKFLSFCLKYQQKILNTLSVSI